MPCVFQVIEVYGIIDNPLEIKFVISYFEGEGKGGHGDLVNCGRHLYFAKVEKAFDTNKHAVDQGIEESAHNNATWKTKKLTLNKVSFL